jgi:hypothetical protein
MMNKLLLNPLPMDRVANRVVNGKAEHWNPSINYGNRVHFETPPTLGTPGELTGLRRGRMKVLGICASGGNGQRYICRCDCGAYETRRAKKLRTPVNPDEPDECIACTQRRSIRLWGRKVLRMPWREQMRALGLTDDEVALVSKFRIDTKGRLPSQIRADLKEAQLAEIVPHLAERVGFEPTVR